MFFSICYPGTNESPQSRNAEGIDGQKRKYGHEDDELPTKKKAVSIAFGKKPAEPLIKPVKKLTMSINTQVSVS